MTVFVDSSVWFAAVFAREMHHETAKKILGEQSDPVTTDHVLVETWLLLKSRFSRDAAESFCERLLKGWCHIEIVTRDDLLAAESIRYAFPDQGFSLVDRTSFVIIERLGISRCIFRQ